MTKKAWLIFALMCVAIIGGMIYLANSNKVVVDNVDVTKIQTASAKNGNIGDHTYGNMNSKVIIVEYGDYQCPGCGSSASVVKESIEKYRDKIGFVFRNYPLYSAHPNAFAASAAAEVIGRQGKYWEMHDKLYAEQSSWNQLTGVARTDYFVTAANSIGADGNKIRDQIEDPAIKKKIDFDEALGKKAGVTGTPSFFIGTKDVGDVYYKDDAIVSKETEGAQLVWSSADSFEKFIIKPALKNAGISE